MPAAKKRKIADESEGGHSAPVDETGVSKSQDVEHNSTNPDAEPSGESQQNLRSADRNQERKERFKALQARAVCWLRPTILEQLNTDLFIANVCSEKL